MSLKFWFLFVGPGMSFADGIVLPQASQMCCDIPLPCGTDIPRLNFLFSFRGDGGVGVDGKKIYYPGFIIGKKCFVVCRRLRRLPTVKVADVHRGRLYRRPFWRLRRLRAVVVVSAILCITYHGHCCQDVKWIGPQVEVVQAWRNDRELPSESVWHYGLIWVVMDSQDLGFWGCDRGNWGHSFCRECVVFQSSWGYSEKCSVADWAHWIFVRRRTHQKHSNSLVNLMPFLKVGNFWAE